MSEAHGHHRRPRPHIALAAVATLAAVAALLSTGCASPPPPRALVIIPSAPEAGSAEHASTRPTERPAERLAERASGIGLAPLRLPEHWQRRQVLHLHQGSELLAWPQAVWAERVEVGMGRRLSQALRQRLPEGGWWTGEEAPGSRRLLIDVQQLDVRAGGGKDRGNDSRDSSSSGEVVGTLAWRLVDRQGRVLDGGRLSHRLQAPIGNAQQEAQALALWLDAQAEALAAHLRPALLSPSP